MNEKKRLVNVADSHSQLGTGDQSDATVSRHSHRELSGRQPQVDELRSAHQAETGDPGFEGSIERIQKEAMEGQGGSEPHHKVLSGSESSEETDRPHSRYKPMDPEMKQAEAKAAAEIGQSKASLKNPGGQS